MMMAFASVALSSHSNVSPSKGESKQNYVQVRCNTCGGGGIVITGYTPWGPTTAFCPSCGGKGYILVPQQNNTPSRGSSTQRNVPQQNQPSFKRTPYYGECYGEDCDCEIFVAKRKGSTTCKCGHSKFAHVKKYL